MSKLNSNLIILDEGILSVLSKSMMNDNQIIDELKYTSIYPCLLRLEQQGYIFPRWNGKIKQYQLTKKGLRKLESGYNLESIVEGLNTINVLKDDLLQLQKKLLALGLIT